MTVDTDTTNTIEWLSTTKAAAIVGVTPRTLFRFIDSGELPAYRFGRVIRLKRNDVMAFIDNARIVPVGGHTT